MEILGKNLNLNDFRQYVKSYDFGSIKPTSLVIHHTWSPKKSDWRASTTINGLKKYYEDKGWSAGPHLFIAEDGVWLFTPMSKVGIHAGEGNATWTRLGKDYTGFTGPLGSKLKSYSIGIEVVGDYDVERWTGETLKNALGAIKFLMEFLEIKTEDVYFHRDFPSAKKSCPGYAITKEWLFAELAKLSAGGSAVQPATEPSSWAKQAWNWQRSLGFDLTILPHQKVEAEWIVTMLFKVEEARKASRL